MIQFSFVSANAKEEMFQKRVKSLRFQLKGLDQKNIVLQQKIKKVNRIRFDYSKSPVSQLQENLHFDRRQVIEFFKPIIEQEASYMRNERCRTEHQMMQSRMNEIQSKKIKARQIEQFDADAIRRIAEFKEKKVTEIRQRNIKEMEINRLSVLKKLENVQVLENEEKELTNMIQLAKLNSTQLQQRYKRVLSLTDGSQILPQIRKFSYNQRLESPFKNRTPNHFSDKILDNGYQNDKKQFEFYPIRRESKSTNKLFSSDINEFNDAHQWTIEYRQFCSFGNKENFDSKENTQESQSKQ